MQLKTAGLLCVCLAALGGCAKEQTIDASSGAPREVDAAGGELVGQSRPPVLDVPVPVGFTLDEGQSRNYNLAGARLVDHVYRGGADKFAVKRFYERQMPTYRWTMVTAVFAQGDMTLDFERDCDRCRIAISTGGLFQRTTIRVYLQTTGRIDPPGGVNRR